MDGKMLSPHNLGPKVPGRGQGPQLQNATSHSISPGGFFLMPPCISCMLFGSSGAGRKG